MQGNGQFGQSVLINERLKGRRNGFFLEIGANNGQALSNSLFFEIERNWSGLLIEPQPSLYTEILRRNRQVMSLTRDSNKPLIAFITLPP